MLIHHFCSTCCLALSFYTGFGSAGATSMFMMSEFSTIFLRLCYLFPKEQQTHPMCIASFLIFLVNFTVLRICMYPMIIMNAIKDTAMMWDLRPDSKNLAMMPTIILGSSLTLLQFYWYYLIWRKLFRLIGKVSDSEESEKK